MLAYKRVEGEGSGPPTENSKTATTMTSQVGKEAKSRTPQLKRRLFKVRIESSVEKSLGDHECIQVGELRALSQMLVKKVRLEEKGREATVERLVLSRERDRCLLKERDRTANGFIAARKKLFAVKRAEEKRNKPPTKAEQRKKMCIYMKHMAGYKDKNFKGKSFNVIKQMFDKAYKQVNDFVPMDTESTRERKQVSKKRACERPSKEKYKRQNYQLINSAMLDDFDRQDVLDLYRLVKERFESTSPEGYDRLLWGDLITLFEPSKEDEI
ncbi:hypothetical protein Tco_0740991 [Tanacetum coccineum]